MTISDLLDKKVRGIFSDDEVLKCDLIALDAKDGKVLFDTLKNRMEYIEQCCGASMQANDRQVTGKLDENTQKHYGFRKKY